MMPLRILHVACWPPPIGGVAVHVKRVARRRAAEGHFVRVYNESRDPTAPDPLLLPPMSWSRFCLHLLWHGADILHVNSNNMRFRSLLWLWRLRGCIVVVTLHTAEEHEQFGPAGTWLRRIVVWNLRHADAIVLAGEGARRGLARVIGGWSNVHVITSWVAPPDDDEEALPADVAAFLERDRPILAANGAVRLRPEGDLYGIDRMLDAMLLLRSRGRDVGLLVYVSSISSQTAEEQAHFSELKRRAAEPPLADCVLLHESQMDDFQPALKRSQVVLRPTLFESFGQTVVQGLMLGKPVVASDAAPRQEGVLLYRSGDVADLARQIERALDDPPAAVPLQLEDAAPRLMALYRELMAGRGGR